MPPLRNRHEPRSRALGRVAAAAAVSWVFAGVVLVVSDQPFLWQPLLAGLIVLTLRLLDKLLVTTTVLTLIIPFVWLGLSVWVQSQRPPPERKEYGVEEMEVGYPFVGTASDGSRVGLYRDDDEVNWRVNTPGTTNCRPRGKRIPNGWMANWTYQPSSHRRFRETSTLPPDDTTVGGRTYNRRRWLTIQGRFITDDTARGTYLRRDVFSRDGRVEFTCIRTARWRAFGSSNLRARHAP